MPCFAGMTEYFCFYCGESIGFEHRHIDQENRVCENPDCQREKWQDYQEEKEKEWMCNHKE